MPPQRIWITGSSGAGKTTLARTIAAELGVIHLELDALYHGPDWTPTEPEAFRAAVTQVVDRPGWVVDGNYRSALDGVVAERAHLVVVIDLPVPMTMARVIRRTVRRAVTRQTLWNGNRERWRNFTRWDPEENIIRWTWDNRHRYRRLALEAERAGQAGGLPCIRLTSPAQVRRFVRYLVSGG